MIAAVIGSCVGMACITILYAIKMVLAFKASAKDPQAIEAVAKLSFEVKDLAERVGRIELSRARI